MEKEGMLSKRSVGAEEGRGDDQALQGTPRNSCRDQSDGDQMTLNDWDCIKPRLMHTKQKKLKECVMPCTAGIVTEPQEKRDKLGIGVVSWCKKQARLL